MQTQYSALGSWFEYLNDDCDYLQWSQYLINKLKEQNAGVNGVDIGCGNGYFTRALYKAGYNVSGIDISPQMLSVAKQKAAKEGVRCEFLLGDITKLKLNAKVDFCVAINDCINYVAKDKIKVAFSKVYANLKKGGVFIFDISSENKIRNIIGENLFGEDRDDITYLWFNKQTESGVVMDLTFFVKGSDGKYERFDERHEQFAHTEQEIITSLTDAGFSNIKSEGHLGGSKAERINFIAVK
jgi:ubiquinone/menaquinone biosynthesis C-methylase UbiE